MSRRRAEVASLLALGGLLVLTAGTHLLLLQSFASPRPRGDERFYLKHAPVVAEWGDQSLLPGRLGFGEAEGWPQPTPERLGTLHHRSPLALNVFAFLVPPELAAQKGQIGMLVDIESRRLTPAMKRSLGRAVTGPDGPSGAGAAAEELFFQRIRLLNLALFLITLVCLYAQGRLLELGPFAALLAPLLLAISPWYGYYVHAAFAEALRTALLNAAFVFLLAYLRQPRLGWLVPAGLVAGYAVLARSSLLPFMLVGLLLVAASTWIAAASLGRRRRVLRTLAAGTLFAGCLLAIVGPEMAANRAAGMGTRLATNTWRNLELGLRGPPGSDPDYQRWWKEWKQGYFDAAPTYREREQAARARTLAFLQEASIPDLFRRQAEKLRYLLFAQPNRLETAIEFGRWHERSAGFEWLLAPSRAHWYALLALGVPALLWVGWRSSGWLLVSAFALYHFAALWVVAIVPRFLITMLPTLALLAAGLVVSVSAMGRRLRAARGRA